MPMIFGSRSEDDPCQDRDLPTKRKTPQKGALPSRMDALERIIALSAVRDRSSRELRERLGRDGYDPKDVEVAIERSMECGIVDDMRFADSFVRGKVAAGKGSCAIERELAKHGIDLASLPGWPHDYAMDEDEQMERAVDYLNSHPPKAKDAWASAYRKLVGRGYSASVASRAARRWSESDACI